MNPFTTSADAEKEARLTAKLKRECGPVILAALIDDSVQEILLNPDGHVWVDYHGRGMVDTGHTVTASRGINLISTVASLRGKLIHENATILETEFPLDGSRFEAVIPEVSEAPIFCLRKKAQRVYSLKDYTERGIVSVQQVAHIREAIVARESLLIVGGPGTGKTTLANAILQEMVWLGNPAERFVILEDTRELQCRAPNTVTLKTTPTSDYQALLRAALRLRPDKICLGECRGSEMLTLLKAWNTGTPGGLATLHANSAEAALIRVGEMMEEAGSVAQPRFICEAIRGDCGDGI